MSRIKFMILFEGKFLPKKSNIVAMEVYVAEVNIKVSIYTLLM